MQTLTRLERPGAIGLLAVPAPPPAGRSPSDSHTAGETAAYSSGTAGEGPGSSPAPPGYVMRLTHFAGMSRSSPVHDVVVPAPRGCFAGGPARPRTSPP